MERPKCFEWPDVPVDRGTPKEGASVEMLAMEFKEEPDMRNLWAVQRRLGEFAVTEFRPSTK